MSNLPKIPTWKRWISYLLEWHIESAPSELNPHLYVSMRNGRFQLCTQHAVYSYEDLYDNFAKAFQKIRFPQKEVLHVLSLGFGLGSVPLLLEKNHPRKYHFTGVERDESVLYLASRYGLPMIHSPVEMHLIDARFFVGSCTETFDLIAMDIFLDDEIPENFETPDFLMGLSGLLNQGGILLYNRLTATKADVKKTEEFYFEKFLKVFPNGAWLDVGGNWMLVNHQKHLG